MQDFELQPYKVSKTEKLARSLTRRQAGRCLAGSIETFNYSKLNDFSYIVTGIPDEVPLSTNPRLASLPFGAVSTVSESGCIAFVTKYILNHFDINLSMEEWISELCYKGYRQWQFQNLAKALSSPRLDFNLIKEELSSDELANFKTIEELISFYGKPVGIDKSFYLIDSVIRGIANMILEDVEYADCRIWYVEDIIYNIQKNIFVPVRVGNSIYHNDFGRRGSSYIIILGFDSGEAIVYDSSIGFHHLPTKRLFYAIAAGYDQDLVAAWDLRKIYY